MRDLEGDPIPKLWADTFNLGRAFRWSPSEVRDLPIKERVTYLMLLDQTTAKKPEDPT